jgi:hypothetical protein
MYLFIDCLMGRTHHSVASGERREGSALHCSFRAVRTIITMSSSGSEEELELEPEELQEDALQRDNSLSLASISSNELQDSDKYRDTSLSNQLLYKVQAQLEQLKAQVTQQMKQINQLEAIVASIQQANPTNKEINSNNSIAVQLSASTLNRSATETLPLLNNTESTSSPSPQPISPPPNLR